MYHVATFYVTNKLKLNPTMKLLSLLTLVCTVLGAKGQVCPPTELLFVFDQSENARLAASDVPSNNDTKFNILQNSFNNFLNNYLIANSPNPFRVGAYGYSSGNWYNIIPEGSSPNVARTNSYLIGTGQNGGSWTHAGLEAIRTRPQFQNNRVIIVSSQGSGNDYRRQLALSEVQRVRQLGWIPVVIAVQGRNPIDTTELTSINGGVPPTILYDGLADPKSYRLLAPELDRILASICNYVIPTQPPTTPAPTPAPRITIPRPSNSLCSQCLFEGGYGFDFDPVYCDSFYQCFPDSEPIKKLCPAGTFWDGAQCNFINAVRCTNAVCDARTPAGTRFPSGRCCNQYYECFGGTLVERSCQTGQYFESSSRQCTTVQNKTLVCESTNRFECDVDRNGPIKPGDCAGYAPDPFGDPCRYQFNGLSLKVAAGTIWNQNKCSLDFTRRDICYNNTGTGDRDFTGPVPANVCNAVFLATYNGGSKAVFSERLNTDLDLYTIQKEVLLANDALTFTPSMIDPFLYYYFFNNRDIGVNTAFRVRFRLDNPQLNRDYDILSNNYCVLCPETISFTVSATSSNRRVINAMFVTTEGVTVSTTAIIELLNTSDLLEMVVIYGDSTVYGKVYEVSGSNTVVRSADFSTVGKSQGTHIAINRCGIQMGKGPNSHFVGLIDDFAVYENCQNINSVLR
ncbi:unnamed protein product [Lymnaea stagnalis]|uniref:Chitin-binding type-2 domain-containing protein n=1 Tax=Lymnaea stagnalis TaxID=6523 RepID=A0AAV2HNZ3_LYMST